MRQREGDCLLFESQAWYIPMFVDVAEYSQYEEPAWPKFQTTGPSWRAVPVSAVANGAATPGTE
jgi:hypothetical protein